MRVPSSGQLQDQTPIYTTPEGTAEGVLEEMASRSAVIFTGTVTAVRKDSDRDLRGNAAASLVEVDFVVDHGVRGVVDGATYAMREWAGLWRDSPRFTPGQRVLALLHGPGPSGLSSPVDGLDGVIPIKATNSSSGNSLTALTSNAAVVSQEDTVDMRWLQAKTLRSQAVSDMPVATPGENFVDGLTTKQTSSAPIALASSPLAQPTTSAGLSHVLGLLMAWQGTQNASH